MQQLAPGVSFRVVSVCLRPAVSLCALSGGMGAFVR
jgi:hypothetical protein